MSESACVHPRALAARRLAPPAATALCAIALALRLPHLGAESLWYDETVSAYLAAQPFRDLLAHTSLDIHPPGYYLLLHGWSRLAGAGEYSLAFLSLWFGVLLVAITYRVTRHFFGSTAALVAAALGTFSAYSVWYSQEVRMYTLGACLCAVLLALTLAHTRRPRPSTTLGWALLAAASLYVLYYALFLVAAMSLALLVAAWRTPERRRCLRLWLLAQVAVVVAYLPWLGTAARQAIDPPVPPWRSTIAIATMLRDGALALLGGEALPASLWPLAAVAVAAAGLGAWTMHHRGGGLAFASFALPWLTLAAASLVTPLFHARYLFPFAPGFWACLGAAIALPNTRERHQAQGEPSRQATQERPLAVELPASLWHRPGTWLVALALLAYGAVNGSALHDFWTNAAYRPDDLRAAVRALADEWCPGDIVLANAGYTYTAIAYYWPGPRPTYERLPTYTGEAATVPVVLKTGSIGGSTSLGWGDPRADFYATTASESTAALQRALDSGSRLWQFRLYDTVTDPDGAIRGWLGSRALLVEDRQIAGPSYARLQAYVGTAAALDCETPADWEGAATTCATVGSEWSGHVPVHLTVRFGVATATPHYSLRLLGAGGQVVAQRDDVLGGEAFAAAVPEEGLVVPQGVSLSTNGSLPTGRYEVQLGLYTFVDGSLRVLHPTPGDNPDLAAQGLLSLGYVDVTAP